MNNIYCVKCKKKTKNYGTLNLGITKNMRYRMRVLCVICRKEKSIFISSNKINNMYK